MKVENYKLKSYSSDCDAQVFLAVYAEENPEGIVFGHTSRGKDLSPKLAAKLEAGLVSDVTALAVEGGNVIFTRPIYSGKPFEKKIVTDGILFATVRPNNIVTLEEDELRSGCVSSLTVAVKDWRPIIQ